MAKEKKEITLDQAVGLCETGTRKAWLLGVGLAGVISLIGIGGIEDASDIIGKYIHTVIIFCAICLFFAYIFLDRVAMEIESAEKGKFEDKWLENVCLGEGLLFSAYMWLSGIALLMLFTIWDILKDSSCMTLMSVLLLFVFPFLVFVCGGYPPSYSLAKDE